MMKTVKLPKTRLSLGGFVKALRHTIATNGFRLNKQIAITPMADDPDGLRFMVEGDPAVSLIEYIHLPEQGISMGVQVQDGIAYLAASFTNSEDIDPATGETDTFCKQGARYRIEGRIRKLMENGHHKLGLFEKAPEGMTTHTLANNLRQAFIPGGQEDLTKFYIALPALAGGQEIYRIDRTMPARSTNPTPNAMEVISTEFIKALR